MQLWQTTTEAATTKKGLACAAARPDHGPQWQHGGKRQNGNQPALVQRHDKLTPPIGDGTDAPRSYSRAGNVFGPAGVSIVMGTVPAHSMRGQPFVFLGVGRGGAF